MSSGHDHLPAGKSAPVSDRPVALVTGVGRTAGIGAATAAIEADLAATDAPALIFDQAERRLGSVTALVMLPR